MEEAVKVSCLTRIKIWFKNVKCKFCLNFL